MASRRVLLIIAILMVLASVCIAADRDNDERNEVKRGGEVRLSGIISDLAYGDQVLAIKDGNFKYTIIAESVRVELRNGRVGTLRDLKKGMMIRVLGAKITTSQIEAHTLIVLEDTDKFDNGRNIGQYGSNDQTEIQGYVTEVNTRANNVSVRASRETYTVDIDAGTEVRRSGYLTSIGGIKEGDNVNVTGDLRGRGHIDARFVQIISNSRDKDNYDDQKNPRIGAVEGTITAAASYFDRSISIRTSYGEIKVDVTKNADVNLDGRSVSIHNISKGLWARAYGEWDGNTFAANRIDAYAGSHDDHGRPGDGGQWPPRDPRTNPPTYSQTRVGVITSIDAKRSILKLDIGLTDMIVNAAGADVTKQGSTVSLSRLQKGDKIQVSGEYSADTLRAKSIQVLKWAEEIRTNDRL